MADLAQQSIAGGKPQRPVGDAGPQTCFVRDPDAYRIEIVQWPSDHPDGITSADFPEPA